MGVINNLLSKIIDRTRLSDKSIQKRYVKAGAVFGDAVSYLGMGECIGFEKLLYKWSKLENEYSNRGFRTISIDRFIELGGYGREVGDVIGVKRNENEESVYHSEIYRNEFLGRVRPSIDFGKLID
jgi:hypothetical protein